MSNQWAKLCDEYSAHNKHLIEQVKEKNKEILRYKQALERIDNAFNDVQLDDEMFNSEVEDILISIKKGDPQ